MLMITQLLKDVFQDGKRVLSYQTPVRLIELGSDYAWIELPSGEQLRVEIELVSSGIHSPEETLPELASLSGVLEDTLLKAAQSGRLMARRSGKTWLSTLNAVNYAVNEGGIRGRRNK